MNVALDAAKQISMTMDASYLAEANLCAVCHVPLIKTRERSLHKSLCPKPTLEALMHLVHLL